MLAAADIVEKGDYEAALTEAFLKTDEDLRAGKLNCRVPSGLTSDPSFFNDPSGCTAVVGLITQDGRLIVVSTNRLRSNQSLTAGELG